MSQVQALEFLILATFLVFAIPQKIKYWFTMSLVVAIAILTSSWSLEVLLKEENYVFSQQLSFTFWTGTPILVIDKLSAFFILVVNFIAIMGSIYSGGYLKAYAHRSVIEFSLHYFSYLIFYTSMVLVPMIREGLAFFFVWELMSVSAFVLTIFDYEQPDVLKAGVKFLIYMHVGMIILMFGFFIVYAKTGELSFDALQVYFSNNPNLPLFMVFFVGFGIKCGFFPLHTWLPHADTAAPAHVAALMSGVTIKMGFYGILRVLSFVRQDYIEIGSIIFGISAITALYGITKAVLHHNLKMKLAYSTIENAGIIGLGIGLGILGVGLDNKVFAMLCFLGSIMHIMNHALFKSLLFFGEGAIYKKMKTRYIEHLGGLLKKMPHTGILFLIACLAVCGLPPFNGFVSKFLIYSGILRALDNAGMYKAAALLFGLITLSLVGGISLFAFSKTYATVFLGSSRNPITEKATEVGWNILVPKYIIATTICLIGLVPSLIIPTLFSITKIYVSMDMRIVPNQIFSILEPLSVVTGVFLAFVVIIFAIRMKQQQKQVILQGSTWGCGYVGSSPKLQYTSTSFSDNFLQLVKPISEYNKEMEVLKEEDIFPTKRSFKATAADKMENMYSEPMESLMTGMKKTTIFQTGSVQHYIMYAFLFIILIAILTFFKLI
jgi:formate hydrogenlyase subunit 3/multisubunit Na+/H+ antiporter MnhD subunit